MKRRILIVEDTATLAENMADILKMEGYEVTIAKNGAEALGILTPENPQLIITDMVMPEMNGIELIKKIRSNTALDHIPIIMLSAAKMEDYDNGLAIQPEIYLKKPCDIDILVDTIDRLLTKYGKD